MDKISNMIISMKNASLRHKDKVSIPFSKFKASIAKTLFAEGYVATYERKHRKKGGDLLELGLVYNEDGTSKIRDVKRMSKSSARMYIASKDIKRFKEGHGRTILSTSKGIMSGEQARKEQVGGEVLFTIW